MNRADGRSMYAKGKERNPELKEAMQDLDDYLFGW